MLNPLFLNQLISKKPDLHEEILQILQENAEPMTCMEIFDKSEVAVTSRDISLEMQRNLKAHGMVEIDRKIIRHGTAAEVAYWKITQAGIDYLNEKQPSDMSNENESENAMTQQTGSALKRLTFYDIVNVVILKGRIKKQALYEALMYPDRSNLKKLQSNVWCLLNQHVLKQEGDDVLLGEKANDFLAKNLKKGDSKKEKPAKVPPYKIVPYDQVIQTPERQVDTNLRSVDADLCTPRADELNPSVKGKIESLHRAEANKPTPLHQQHVDETKKSSLTSGAEKFAGVFQDEILSAFQKEKPAAPSQFRVAYTSDGCLIIMGLQFMPIELDVVQTRELISYVDDMKLGEVA